MKINRLLFLLFTCGLLACTGSMKTKAQPETKAEKQGWKLSMQSYTFHLFSVTESLDKTKELGLHYIEIYPGQKMGEGFGGDAVFGYNLTTVEQNRLKELAKEKGVKIVSSGVWTPARDEWEKVFEFAKGMEMEFISAEPAREDWDIVESLAKKAGGDKGSLPQPSKRGFILEAGNTAGVHRAKGWIAGIERRCWPLQANGGD